MAARLLIQHEVVQSYTSPPPDRRCTSALCADLCADLCANSARLGKSEKNGVQLPKPVSGFRKTLNE